MSIFFHDKTDKTRKYTKSAIFVWYENSRRRLLGAQSINAERASLTKVKIEKFEGLQSHTNVSYLVLVPVTSTIKSEDREVRSST